MSAGIVSSLNPSASKTVLSRSVRDTGAETEDLLLGDVPMDGGLRRGPPPWGAP